MNMMNGSRRSWAVLASLALLGGCVANVDASDGEEAGLQGTGTKSSPALAAPVHITFDNLEWETLPDGKYLHDETSGINYRVPIEGGAAVKAWISPSLEYEGNRVFGARLYEVPADSGKQRVELTVALGDGSEDDHYHPHLMEESRYYGFSLYVHPQSKAIDKNVTFAQAWQNHATNDGTTSKRPPFSLQLLAGTDYRWKVEMANEEGPDPKGNSTTIYTSPGGLAKGVWHEFIYRFKPSVTQSGYVEVWYNGQSVVRQSNQRNFGYTPTTQYPVVTNEFQVRFGAYRGNNEDIPTREIILLFGDVRIGNTYAQVVP